MKIEEALEYRNLPNEYKLMTRQERVLVKGMARGRLLDVACGRGDIIPDITERAESYTGIDVDLGVLTIARKQSERFSNSRVLEQSLYSMEDLGTFDVVLFLGNTLGCLESEIAALEQIGKVAKCTILVTLMAKGALETRKKYYADIPHRIDPVTETIYSPTWGLSRAYNPENLEAIGRAMNAQLVDRLTPGGISHMGVYKKR